MSKNPEQPLQFWLDHLGRRLVQHRLNNNLTQVEMADNAGISLRTLARLEAGKPTQFENFLRALIALGLQDGLEGLVPEVPESPIQQLERSGRSRKRATGRRKPRADASEPWSWDDES
ncbi:MAG: helix-turn-helix domain-containing protein [Candidatus Binatia bacterium]